MREMLSVDVPQLSQRVSQYLAVAVVNQLPIAVEANLRNTNRGLREDRIEALLAFSQCLLGSLAFERAGNLRSDRFCNLELVGTKRVGLIVDQNKLSDQCPL